MNLRGKFVFSIGFLGLLCLLMAGSLRASETELYTYTGEPYDPSFCTGTYEVFSSPGFHECAGAYAVTGSFTTTLSLSQLENLHDFVIPNADIASFSFSDGSGLIINQSDANLESTLFEITTNGSGNITSPQDWHIVLVDTHGDTIVTDSCDVPPCVGALDASFTGNPGNGGETVFDNPGKWQGPTPTPEVPSSFLFGTGLLGIMQTSA